MRGGHGRDLETERFRATSLHSGIKYLRSAVEGGIADAGFQLGKLYEHVSHPPLLPPPLLTLDVPLCRVLVFPMTSPQPTLTIFGQVILVMARHLFVQQI
jgi:hypothetical protein